MVVGVEYFVGVGEVKGVDGGVFCVVKVEQVGQVVFVCFVVVVDVLGEFGCLFVEDIDVGVEFFDGFFSVVGVFLFYDVFYCVVFIVYDVVIVGGVGQFVGQYGYGVVLFVVVGDEFVQGVGLQQWCIVVKYQNVGVVFCEC